MDEKRGWIGKEDGWKMSNPTTRLNNVRNSVRSNPVNQKLRSSLQFLLQYIFLYIQLSFVIYQFLQGFYFQSYCYFFNLGLIFLFKVSLVPFFLLSVQHNAHFPKFHYKLISEIVTFLLNLHEFEFIVLVIQLLFQLSFFFDSLTFWVFQNLISLVFFSILP